jgi:ribosomal protein L27
MDAGVMGAITIDASVIKVGAIRVRLSRGTRYVRALPVKRGAMQTIHPFRRGGDALACLTVNAFKTAMRQFETFCVNRFFRLKFPRARTLMPA